MGELVAGSDLRHLPAAMVSAVAAADPADRSMRLVGARRAAVHVGSGGGATTRQLSDQLGLSRRGIQRLAAEDPDPALVRAIRWQLGLRERLGVPVEAPPSAPTPSGRAPIAITSRKRGLP